MKISRAAPLVLPGTHGGEPEVGTLDKCNSDPTGLTARRYPVARLLD